MELNFGKNKKYRCLEHKKLLGVCHTKKRVLLVGGV